VELQAQVDSLDREMDVLRFQFNRLLQDQANLAAFCARRGRRR
jgi:hypothetical protein